MFVKVKVQPQHRRPWCSLRGWHDRADENAGTTPQPNASAQSPGGLDLPPGPASGGWIRPLGRGFPRSRSSPPHRGARRFPTKPRPQQHPRSAAAGPVALPPASAPGPTG